MEDKYITVQFALNLEFVIILREVAAGKQNARDQHGGYNTQKFKDFSLINMGWSYKYCKTEAVLLQKCENLIFCFQNKILHPMDIRSRPDEHQCGNFRSCIHVVRIVRSALVSWPTFHPAVHFNLLLLIHCLLLVGNEFCFTLHIEIF